MGAKASTAANSGNQSPSRARTFSTSSSSDVVSGSVASNVNGGASGFNFLRSIHGVDVTNDNRQRARSLSSVVPDIHHHPHNHHHTNHSNHSNMTIPTNSSNIQSLGVVGVQQLQMSSTSTEDSSNSSDNNTASAAMLNALGRVYTATSLPSHIWSLNGIKCPVCSKFILPDDIECHLVMCLTKPRLSYNEDVLNDAKGECVICLEELNAGDLIARLPCLCIYHKNCIDQWFEVNRSCPEHPSD